MAHQSEAGAAYNRIDSRTTFDLFKPQRRAGTGCLVPLTILGVATVTAVLTVI